MWTIDMNRCPGCPHKEKCADRLKILQTLSAASMELNTNPAHLDGPGDGVIIVACQEKF